jgi:hypothetical protein
MINLSSGDLQEAGVLPEEATQEESEE